MATKNIWSVKGAEIRGYRLHYEVGHTTAESINNIHREIVFLFGGIPLDVSLNSSHTVGMELSVPQQRLDDKTVIEVCTELLNGKTVKNEQDSFSDVASIVFDWVYIQAVLQRFGGIPDIQEFNFFTDMCMHEVSAYSGARAVAVLRVLSEQGDLCIIDDFEKFSIWHSEHVLGIIETPDTLENYKIIQSTNDHVSVVSRLSKNIFKVVADETGRYLWGDTGKYIIYAGNFEERWLSDFSNIPFTKAVIA